ncbi:hypothetical protein UFOVP1336_32 [uncultured Caudovirales phage]|uniref:Uncharacterized protein n=1 Tax=uncultured Caudovirales phage TaxID=2100421 RepID=A0A6J5RQG5_9CAUD|nr:hypothetical protein UFOVP1336_32 [uncultured Caudovirales phage]
MSLAGRITLVFRDFTHFRGKYTPELVMAAQYESAKAGAIYIYPKLVRATPVGATSLLRQSTIMSPPIYSVAPVVGRAAWEIKVQMGATGGASLYAEFVELGRKPGKFPPIEPIRKWVRRVLRITGESNIRSVAYLVGRKIARQGTPAQNYTKNTVEQNEAMTKSVMAMAALRVLKNPRMNQMQTVVRKV